MSGVGYQYDFATKLWTILFAIIVMALIQWPALFTALLQSPNTRGNMAWNVIACLLPMLVSLAWIIDEVVRKRIPIVWAGFFLAGAIWLFVSVGLVNP